jgi:phosphonate transport system substrate-binding protein
MKKVHATFRLTNVLALVAIVAAACTTATPTVAPQPTSAPATTAAPATVAPTATTAPTAEPATAEPATPDATATAAAEIGTADHPIKVLFVPSVDAAVITTGGELMAQALNEATGLTFEVSVPTSYAATIEEICASPTDTMAFIPAQGYVLANQLCGVDVSFKAVRRGWGVYWTEFIVRRDSDINSLEDLAGKSWAYPDAGSTSGYLAPLVFMKENNIEFGEQVEAGGHPQVVNAVANGEADFGTTFFSPYAVADGMTAWDIGDEPDVPADVVDSCAPNENGLFCGDYQVLDARANVREEVPDIVQQVKILTLTEPIPNDTLSFAPDFPAELRAQIEAALVTFATTDAWAESIGNDDFYGWSGLEPATDAEYDVIRLMVEEAGITLEDLK